jgi:spoIIIJ-associated protein
LTGDVVVEATGETVGEAKWAALRELERRQPGLDKTAVRFEVLTEGERGLLGVGYAPARVVAMVEEGAGAVREPAVAPVDESDLAADVRFLLEEITDALDVDCRVEVHEDEAGIRVDCVGTDLGALIGRYGQTIDAVQYLVNAIVAKREGERIEVTVDAAGYRERRRATLEQLASRSAERVLSSGRPLELEPMSAVERKVVHLHLQDLPGVATSSEGTEPNRYVVISPT